MGGLLNCLPTVTGATVTILTTIELFIWLKALCPKLCFAVQKGNWTSKALPIEKLIVRLRSYVSLLFCSFNALIKVVGLHPTPDKEDCSSYPPWMLQDAPNGVESPLCSLTNLLSLPKDASLHLRKLSRHPWRDSRNFSIRPAATPRGGVFLGVLSR